MDSYFNNKNTGGSNGLLGYEYQDYCCLSTLFENLVKDNFISLSVETINDFTIIFNSYEMSVQVKKRRINLSLVKSLLEETNFEKNKIYIFIGTSISDDVEKLNTKINWFKNAMSSKRNEIDELKIKKHFINELKKYKMEGLYEKLIFSKFISISKDYAFPRLYANYTSWLDTREISVNRRNLLNELLVKVREMGCNRDYLEKEDLDVIINNHKVESSVEKIIDKLYDRKFKTPSEILRILGEDKEDILKKLEKQIIAADNYIMKKEFDRALEIYTSLAMFYEEEPVLVNCAMLSEVLYDYNKAINYCNRVLNLNSKSFEAYFILGTTYGNLNQIDKSLEYLISAKEIKETAELYYNLGYIYYLKEDSANAYDYYTKCLQMDDTMAEAHLNISDLVNKFDAILHLDKAIQLDNTMYQAYGKKGELLRDIGLYDLAVKYFKKCLSIDKNNFQALQGVSLSLLDLGRPEEAVVYLARWIRTYKEKLLPEDMEAGKFNMLMDINWHRTRWLLYKKVDEENILINMPYGDVCFNIYEDKQFILIGAFGYGEKEDSIYPIVGKIYESKESYKKAKNNILSNLELSIIDKNIYLDNKSQINVIIREYSDDLYISISFADFEISGYTAEKSEGYRLFSIGYSYKRSLGVFLQCKETHEEFIIKGVTNISIEKIKENSTSEGFKNDITKQLILDAMRIETSE